MAGASDAGGSSDRKIGPYRLHEKIGEGGMGSVWVGEHSLLGRRAAIKLLHPKYSSETDVVQRFFNEGRAATAIADPGIVQIFDFGHAEDGTAYIAMELLAGEPLDRRLKREGTLAISDALRLMRQVASSLGVAHARNIVHRDLKPENVFIARDPEVPSGERTKILDFGIAKLAGDAKPGVETDSGALLGSPLYMSPEQCRGAGEVDQRSDVYSVGCMLFAAITGAPPFIARGVGDVIAAHLREPAPAPSSKRPGLPREVDALVLRCLAKDPDDRFANGSELAAALGELAARPSAEMATVATMLPPSRPTPVGLHTTLQSSAVAVAPTRAPRRRAMGAAIAGGALAAGGLAWWVARGDGNNAREVVTAVAPTPPPEPHVDSPPPPAADAAPLAPEIAQAKAQLATVLAAFVRWSAQHASSPCPKHGELGVSLDDPWHHALAITCTDQPQDQIIGVTSAGPDGAFDTADDIVSWNLGPEVTALVRGPRWHPTAVRPATPHPIVPADAGVAHPGIPDHR